MSRIAYVNGSYVPLNHAQVSMQDRGYHFADGVYEVIALCDGRMIDGQGHLQRLERSLTELGIPMPCSMQAMVIKIKELCRRNTSKNGLIYMQVTRGVAARKHTWNTVLTPSFTMAFLPVAYPDEAKLTQGVRVITTPDQRWERCDVKSIALLPNVLAKMKAQEAGAYEAWQYKADGTITEGSLSNAYIVKDGTIITHPATKDILGGITREAVLALAEKAGIAINERPFHKDALASADEAFVTGASAFVTPVVQVDDIQIGTGKVGATTNKLIQAWYEHLKTQPTIRNFTAS